MASLVDVQFWGIFCQVLYRHAEVVSGAYKLRKTQQGCEKTADNPDGWRDLTDDEKLDDSLKVMQIQIHRLREFEDGATTDDEAKYAVQKVHPHDFRVTDRIDQYGRPASLFCSKCGLTHPMGGQREALGCPFPDRRG